MRVVVYEKIVTQDEKESFKFNITGKILTEFTTTDVSQFRKGDYICVNTGGRFIQSFASGRIVNICHIVSKMGGDNLIEEPFMAIEIYLPSDRPERDAYSECEDYLDDRLNDASFTDIFEFSKAALGDYLVFTPSMFQLYDLNSDDDD